ncbi:MAG: alpha/beta hydrolase [Myxococcales bacterium]|nr:alpha/beta hydrolase [Myxococcales bacterium]
MRALTLSLALTACSERHDQITVVVEDAALPVAVHGNPSTGTLILFESGGPSGPGIAERAVGLVDFRDTLEQHALVAMYDRRGVGNAQGTFDPDDLHIDVLLDDLGAVRDVLEERYQPDQIVLMGHSFGASSSALYLSQDRPGFDAWIPVAPGWSNDDRTIENTYRHPFVCRVAQDQLDLGVDDALFIEIVEYCERTDPPAVDSPEEEQLWEYVGALDDRFDDFALQTPGLLTTVFFSHYNLIDAQLRGNLVSDPVHDSLRDTDLLDVARLVSLPTLAITGELDSIGNTEMTQAVVDDLADAELVQLDDASHYPMHSDPGAFADAVLPFLQAR